MWYNGYNRLCQSSRKRALGDVGSSPTIGTKYSNHA